MSRRGSIEQGRWRGSGRARRSSTSTPRWAFLLAPIAALCVASCIKVGEGKEQKKPDPPPPSEKVPQAPGPDNNIKRMPAPGEGGAEKKKEEGAR